jgi:hypothetical protein
MIVGIDNGIDGGICAISPHGKIIDKCPMPILKRKEKREVDVAAFKKWILDLNTEPFILIEEPLKHAKSSQAMRSMSINFGKLLGACEIKEWLVAAVEPREWQVEILGRVAAGQTKTAALNLVSEIAPEEDWTKKGRSTKPHDGMIDAYLIAEFGRRKYPNECE